jgi:hypothetical protein
MTEPSTVAPAVEQAVADPAAEPAVTQTTAVVDEVPPPIPGEWSSRVDGGTGFLLALGLVWLATRLWSAHANIHDAGDGLSRLIVAAYQLPDVIAASTLAGAACGVASVAWRDARRPGGSRRGRWLTGTLAGLVTGLLVGAAVVLGYGSHSPDLVLAASVLAACTLGGAGAAIPATKIVAAGVAATFGAFVVGVALNVFQTHIVDLFGPGTTAASHLAAANRAALAESLLGGATAGLIAFLRLRRRGADRRFLAYLGAGATPGILILLAEVVTRVGGAQLFTLARKISPADSTAVDYFGSSRINHALIVLFTGMIVALFAFGRTLPRPARRAASFACPERSFRLSQVPGFTRRRVRR